MVGGGDVGNVVCGEFFLGAVYHGAHVAGINKEGLSFAVAEAVGSLSSPLFFVINHKHTGICVV
jgi:hypothetical protein